MKPSDFIHPEDAAALRQLESIPGFTAIFKKFMSLGYETLMYGENMASSIRLSETQLPEIYHHLPPICKKLGIAEPEFYLKMDPNPNAWTFGDTRIYITVTSGLVEMMTSEELDAIIAHECGHILCRHVLYNNLARSIIKNTSSFLGALSTPLVIALLYWNRKSELSADRAGAIITSPDVVASAMARFSGGPRSITSKVNMAEWAKQADEYDKIYNDGTWNRLLQIYNTIGLDHPFCAVRVREILKWGATEQYLVIKGNVEKLSNASLCPNCGNVLDPNWKFCQYCGTKL